MFCSGSNHFSHTSNMNVPSNSQHFAQVQASGYSPALQRKKNSSILSNSGRPMGWMTEPAAPSAAAVFKDRDFTASHEVTFHHDRHPFNGPHSILVRPDSHKTNTDKVMSYWWCLARNMRLHLFGVKYSVCIVLKLFLSSLFCMCLTVNILPP